MDPNIELDLTVVQDGWTVTTDIYRICVPCLVEAGADADMGMSINEEDKLIRFSHYYAVPADQCDYVTEHKDALETALQALVARGDVKVVIEDGETKYQAI